MQPINQAGQFRALITDYGLVESKDGAVGISVKAAIWEKFDFAANEGQGAWESWEQYQVEAEGTLWIVGKNEKGNKINDLAVNSLISHAGWDGNIESISGKTWQPAKCQVAIEEDDYKDQKRFRIAFVNDYDRNPFGMGTVAPEKAKQLQARFGSQLRALAGNAKRNTAPANGSTMPAPPPAAHAPLTPAGERQRGEEIPF